MENNTLGQYLRKLRKTYGYTQEYVASHLNIIHQTYSHYETGRIMPPADSLYNLARLYNISIEELMTFTVNYQINSDYIVPHSGNALDKELTRFLEYADDPVNQKKFKALNRREKELLYYFQQLTTETQDESIDILKVQYRHRKPGSFQ